MVELPGSKSYSNRALLVAALAAGRSEITEALFSDDTRYMHRALEALGVRVQADAAARTVRRRRRDGRFTAPAAALDVANSGTTARFLTAAAALADGPVVIDGEPAHARAPDRGPRRRARRARRRAARSSVCDGCPPVRVAGGGGLGGLSRASTRGGGSSQ